MLRLEKLEKGESTAILDEKMAKIESKLDSLEEVNQQLTKYFVYKLTNFSIYKI